MMVQPKSPATVCELERVGLRHAFHRGVGPEIRNFRGRNRWPEESYLITSFSCEPYVTGSINAALEGIARRLAA